MLAVLEAIEKGTFTVEQGRRIWLSRRASGLSQQYFADILQADVKRIRRIESGEADAKNRELHVIAKETGQSFGYLTLHHDNFDDNPVPGKFHFKPYPRGNSGSGIHATNVLDQLFVDGMEPEKSAASFKTVG